MGFLEHFDMAVERKTVSCSSALSYMAICMETQK